MFKQTLALAAGIALSVSAVFAHAADVLKVSAIPDKPPPSCCASSSRWVPTWSRNWA